MICIPVSDEVGRKFVMFWVTEDDVARLQAGQKCDILAPGLASLGVDGVVIRYAANDVDAVAAARKIQGVGSDVAFHVVMRDKTGRSEA